jgi:uncharacterized protein
MIFAVKQALTLWILGDGKPGHENQSLGLAEAIGRRLSCEVYRIPASPLRDAFGAAKKFPRPDLIVAAGHSTHGLLCWLAWRYRSQSVVMMRPSLPCALFDMVIAPEHDFRKSNVSNERLLMTRGAINRVKPDVAAARHGSLVLLGGPSKHHGWDVEAMRGMLREIAQRMPAIEVADSRRTPDGFFDSLDFIKARHSHDQTPQGWLAGRLAHAAEVWVTEDSVSMVYEALSGGARVGVLPVPRLRENARVIQGIDRLAAEGWVSRFDEWKESGILQLPPGVLAEADRSADWVLGRIGHLEKEVAR